MKYITKKVIKGRQYYYLQYNNYTKLLGHFRPVENVLKKQLIDFFGTVAEKEYLKLDPAIKKELKYVDLKKLEIFHYLYLCLKHELFEREYYDFYSNFIKLFTYNSNKAEGSKTNYEQVKKINPYKMKKPKTRAEIEVMESFIAFSQAFANDIHWNMQDILNIHELLLDELDPLIAGRWKEENNVVGNQLTVDYREVVGEMKKLLFWFNDQLKKDIYPPIVAVKFYCKFERIHPFLDGNGRVGRILFNAILNKFDYLPVIFFASNREEHSNAIKYFLEDRPVKMYRHYWQQCLKTYKQLSL